MKYLVLAVVLLFAANVAYGLECYQCTFHSLPDDLSGLFPYKSDKDCENNPKKTVTCGQDSATPFGLVNATAPLYVPSAESKAVKWMCMKGEGTVKVDGGKAYYAIGRSCMMAEEKKDGKCDDASESWGGITLSAETCFCADNKCNSGVVSKSSVFLAGVLAVAAIMFK